MAREKANFHGYEIDQVVVAKHDLGIRAFEEFMNARRRALMGQEIPPSQNGPNLPFMTANNRKWTPECRY